VVTQFGPGVDYQQFGSTFAWHPPSGPGLSGERAPNPTLDAYIRGEIEDTLDDRGYSFAVDDEPDFIIDYSVRRRAYGGVETAATASLRPSGTLVIDIVNAHNGNHVWRGYAVAWRNPTATPNEQRRKIHAAVEAILHRFPREGTQ
jgi:hypothetical protein